MLLRLVTDPRISSSLVEIETQWTLCDAWDAMITLDVMSDAEVLVHRKANKK